MFKRNTRTRTPVELAAKWRLQSGAPEVQARTPNSEIWQAAARGEGATGPDDVLQSGLQAGLQALHGLASQGPATSGGIVPEQRQGPRDVAGPVIASGTGGFVEVKPGRGRGMGLPHYPETPGTGGRSGGPGAGGPGAGGPGAGNVFAQAGGLLGDLLKMAKARGAFAEQESVFRQEALARQGQAALGLKAEAGRWYEQLGRKLGGEIAHPGLRQDFLAYANARAQSGQGALHSHETAQADALRSQALAHAPALAARNAALWNADPEQVERELDDAAWTVRMLGPDDPGEKDAMLRAATQRVLGRAIETRAAEPDPDPAGARTLLERWRDRLDEAEAARLEAVFSTVEQTQRRASAWDELAPNVRHDADMAALHGRFGDPDFIGRHGLDENDAAQLAGRLDVAHAAAARTFAREQAEGLARETNDFWTAASQDPLTAFDRLQTAAFLPQEQRDFLRQTLLDPTWDGERREFAGSGPGNVPRGAQPLPHYHGRPIYPEADSVQTLENAPGNDAPMFREGLSASDSPAQAVSGQGGTAQPPPNVEARPDIPEPGAPNGHEEWKLRQMGAETPSAAQNREYEHGIVPAQEIRQQEDMRALIDQMARLKYPDTGDLNQEANARREEYRQEMQRRFVSDMALGKDARQIAWKELEVIPSTQRPDAALINSALTPRPGVDPLTLGNAISNDEKSLTQYTRDRGQQLDDINALWSKKLGKTITPEESQRLERLERDLPPEVRAKGFTDWLNVAVNSELQDLADKAENAKMQTGAALAATAAGSPVAGLGIFASAAARREFETSAGGYYKEFSQTPDKNGNPMPDDLARLGAYAGGLMDSGLEVAEYIGLGKIAGSSTKLTEKSGGAALKELLKDPKNYQAIGEGAIKAGKMLGIDSLKTLGETTVQHLHPGLVKTMSDFASGTEFEPRPNAEGAVDTLEDASRRIVLGNVKKRIVK